MVDCKWEAGHPFRANINNLPVTFIKPCTKIIKKSGVTQNQEDYKRFIETIKFHSST